MTAFFVPELGKNEGEEEVYDRIKRAAQAETGHAPQEERIWKLWSRRDGVDCEAEVGKPDPMCGETVRAIFDLGRHSPYLIHCGSPGEPPKQVIVGKPVYGVTAFTSPEL